MELTRHWLHSTDHELIKHWQGLNNEPTQGDGQESYKQQADQINFSPQETQSQSNVE